MHALLQDLRYSVRMFAQRPGFAPVVVLLLVLGIGANTTVFSLMNAALFKPIPGVAQPEQLVAVYTSDYSSGLYGTSSYPDYADFRDQSNVFSGLAAFAVRPKYFRAGDEGDRLPGMFVTGNYFAVLGVQAAAGRVLLSGDDAPGSPGVVVLSHGFWTQRFGADPAVVGMPVTIDNRPYTVVGVAAEGFAGTRIGQRPAFWIPMATQPADLLAQRGSRWLSMVGRLKPEATLTQAQAQMTAIMGRLAQQHPQSNLGTLAAPDRPRPMTVVQESRIGPRDADAIQRIFGLLMAVVGVVLLIACVNIANLLLARASARRHEIAVRLALGASRGRLVRQLITESLLLSLVSGAVTLAITVWTARAVLLLLPANMGAGLDFGLDYRIFLFTAGLSVITGVLFGLAPALRASKPALIPVLKKEAGVPMGRFGLRNALVTGQIALSLMLLIGAGLFVRSLRNAAATDLGFDPENLLIASIDLQNDIRSPDQAVSRYDEILERIKTLPGVRSAALAWSIPVSGGGSRTSFQIDGYTPQPKEDMELNYNVVGLGYFSTLGIPLVQGRDFTPQDRAGGVDVVIVNEAFAQRYFAGQNPLGRSVRRSGTVCEIIGLVKTGRYRNLRESPLPYVYMAFAQGPHATMSVVMRTAGDPVGLIPAVRAEIRHVNRNIPVYNISTMSDVVRERLAFDRMITVLSGVFGGIALVLASIGLYGVTAYAVAQRTREIGIRMALGAQKGDVLRLILRHGMGMAGAGVALGLAVAFGVTRLVSAMLYDVSATDLATFIAVSLLLALVALLACYLPARRATRVDPLAALRYE